MTIPITTTEPVQPGEIERSSGYTFGGRELTRTEARAQGLPVAPTTSLPAPAKPPRYSTGRLWTRHELMDLFTRTWKSGNVGLQDVDVFLRTAHLSPVAHQPYPDMPTLPSDEDAATDAIRWQMFSSHENGRNTSRKSRELFDIDGLEQFVPAAELPSQNDTRDERVRKNERIHALS